MSEFKVNGKDYGFIPKVVGTSGGDFVIAWLRIYGNSERQFLASKYNSNGQILDSEFEVSNSTQFGWPNMHIANIDNRGFVVTYDHWLKKYDNVGSISYSLYDNPDKPSKECNIDNHCDINSESAVAELSTGNIIFTTSSYDGLFYFKESKNLENFYKVEIAGGEQAKKIAVKAVENGDFIVSWLAKHSLYARMYDNSASLTKELVISEEVEVYTIATLNDGGFIVAWTSSTSFPYLYAKKYNQDLSLSCEKFKIPDLELSGVVGLGDNPSATGLNAGQFVVTWMNGGDYYAKIYKNDCSVVIGQFKVNSEISKSIPHPDYSIPSVATLSNGNYVITWPSTSSVDISNTYAKIFSTPHCNIIANDQALTTLQYISAKLSLEVYGDSGGSLPSGWITLITSSDKDVPDAAKEGHYYGKAYKDSNNNIIIAHRGTQVTYGDLCNDYFMWLNSVPGEYNSAVAFIDYVVNHYLCTNGITDAQVSLTGHSLGAALAELTAAHFHFPAITFESPGTYEIMKNNAHGIDLGDVCSFTLEKHTYTFTDADFKYVDKSVVSYLSAPNIVNSMSNHIGSIVRVYPELVSQPDKTPLYQQIGFFGQPSWQFYTNSYSIKSQHSMLGMLAIFNNNNINPSVQATYSEWPSGTLFGYNGYDNYNAIACNSHYWLSHIQYLAKVEGIKGIWWRFQYDAIRLLNKLTINDKACKENKVAINTDDTGNLIWGSVYAGATIRSGSGNDEFLLYGLNNEIIDSGGNNIYRIIGNYEFDNSECKKEKSDTQEIVECVKIGNIGKVIIDDTAKSGEIYIGDQKLSGEAIRCTTDFCSTSKIGEIYVLMTQENNGYLMACTNSITYIFRSGVDFSKNTINELNNYVAIKSFNWNDFNITQKGEKVEFLFSNKDWELLDCSKVTTKCIAISFNEGTRFQAFEHQDATFIMNYESHFNKVIILPKQTSISSKIFSSLSKIYSSDDVGIKISGLKIGDQIDLSQLYIREWNIKRDVQEGIISINGDSIEFKINKDYPLTVTDLNQDCNITTKVDPNLYYENSPVPNPDSGGNWHWYDTFGVAAGSIVGTGVLAVLGRFAYLKYCQQGGATLLNDESIDRSLLDSVPE
ncbi:MAG: hypothetical protein K2P53_04060 [Rickettsiales bacterium]|jgi:hypothetical protein|nr:hypothetical protein [Rickettsiales bacterium]